MDDIRKLTEIYRIKGGSGELVTDIVIKESSLTIMANGIKLTSLACLAEKQTELGYGYLFTESLVRAKDDIISYRLSPCSLRIEFQINISDRMLKLYTDNRIKLSGCGDGFSSEKFSEMRDTVPPKNTFPPFPFSLKTVAELMQSFQQHSGLFLSTGGVHSAALADNRSKEIVAFADDIGRHNAVDKVIGTALINNINLTACTLLTTGRISFEIVNKVANMNIPVLISRSAPTSKAIAIAYRSRIYLIGFARGERCNLYTGLNELLTTTGKE